ncbi:MAG: hypothetical protein Q9200_006017 [Gallowayella weberi]
MHIRITSLAVLFSILSNIHNTSALPGKAAFAYAKADNSQPWVALDFFDQSTCSGIEMIDRPLHLSSACQKFSPPSNFMAILWPKAPKKITLYADDNCKDIIRDFTTPPTPPGRRPHDCVDLKKDFKKPIRSAKMA